MAVLIFSISSDKEINSFNSFCFWFSSLSNFFLFSNKFCFLLVFCSFSSISSLLFIFNSSISFKYLEDMCKFLNCNLSDLISIEQDDDLNNKGA